jgi:hypothetical protein
MLIETTASTQWCCIKWNIKRKFLIGQKFKFVCVLDFRHSINKNLSFYNKIAFKISRYMTSTFTNHGVNILVSLNRSDVHFFFTKIRQFGRI